MPRTKQQKPRHIVERENANGPSPTLEAYSESDNDVMDEEQEEAMTYPPDRHKESPDPDSRSGNAPARRRTAEEFNESEARAPAQSLGADQKREMPLEPRSVVSPAMDGTLSGRDKMDARHPNDSHFSDTRSDRTLTRGPEEDLVESDFRKGLENKTEEEIDSTNCSRSDGNAQYSALAHYMSTIKMLLDNNNHGVGVDPNAPLGDLWPAWAMAARRCAFPDTPGAQGDPMVQAYMAQLSERWSAMLGQRLDKPAKGPDAPAPSPQQRVAAAHSPKLRGGRHPRTPNGGTSFQPPASDSPLSRGRLGAAASQPQTKTGDGSSSSEPIHAHDAGGAAIEESPSSGTENATGNYNFTDSASSPHSAPAAISDQASWQMVPYQAPRRPWSPSSALGLPSPSTTSRSNAFRFPSPRRDPPATAYAQQKAFENKSDDSYSRQPAAGHKKQGSFSSASSISHDGTSLPPDSHSPSSGNDSKSPRQPNANEVSPQVKAPGEFAYFPESADVELRNHAMPYAAFPPSWMGMPLPGGVLSPPFGGLSPGGVPHSQSQLLFPSRLPLVPGTLSASHQLSPRMGGLPPNPSFLDSFPASSAKSSAPRRRTRGPPIDSVHAAIVREAKEQFKGLDPENMYIQCPICQKRIKRLYHFQRHMRIHTGEKTHHCPCCQYKSVRKDNLKSHMKTHEKQNIENSRRAGRAAFQGPRGNDADPLCRARGPIGLPGVPKPVNDTSPGRAAQLNAIADKAAAVAAAPLREPPLKAAPDYKATFASSYAPPYPFPYFPQPYHPYINTSPGNQGRPTAAGPSENTRAPERKHHSLPTTPDASCERSTGTQAGRSSDTAASSPAGLGRNGVELSHSVSPKSLKRGIEEAAGQGENAAIPLFPAEAKRQKQLHAEEASPTASSNSNHNNSNPVKDERIFRAWGAENAPRDRKFANAVANLSPVAALQNQNALLGFPRFDPSTVDLPKYPFYAESNMMFQADARKGMGGLDEPRSKSSISSASSSLSSAFSPSSESRSREGTPKTRATSVIKSPTRSGADHDTARNRPSLDGDVTPGAGRRFGEVKVKVEAATPESSPGAGCALEGLKSEVAQEAKSPPGESAGGNKEQICRLCSHRATSANDLQTHMTLAHKQDGFYKCDVCNYLGKNLSKLVEHNRIHTGERPFKCDQCNYAAKRKDNLAQHKAVRHDKRKAKGGGLYTVLDQINQHQRDASATTTRHDAGGLFGAPSKSNGYALKQPPLFGSDFQGKKSDPTAGLTDAEKLANGGIPIAPLFQSFPPVHAVQPYLYPFCFPAPLAPGALSGAAHPSGGVNERPSNPGSYSLKVRAALITP